MSDLAPHLQEVRELVLNNFYEGGVEACQITLGNFTQEVEFIGLVALEARNIVRETVENKDSLTKEEMKLRLEFVQGINQDRRSAISRHNYAGKLVMDIERMYIR